MEQQPRRCKSKNWFILGIAFLTAIIICGLLLFFFTNLFGFSALLGGNDNIDLDESFLKLKQAAVDFHNSIAKLESSGNTTYFTAVDENGETILHKAVKEFPVLNQTLDIFKTYVNFSAVDKAGNTAFFNAVQYGRNALFLTTLISYGMEWKTTNKNKDTALHVASLYGNLKAVKLLLSLGSDVNVRNSNRRYPLHQAVVSSNVSQNTLEIVRELLAHGANALASAFEMETALHLATRNKHLAGYMNQIVRILIEKAPDVNAVNRHHNTLLHLVGMTATPSILHETVEYLVDVNNTNSFNMMDYDKGTVLNYAVERMEVQNETLSIFQRHGFDFNTTKSILFFAISGGRSGSFLKTLIAFGADWRRMEYQNYHKNTALHYATQYGNLDAVKLFIELAADVNAPNIYGQTPLHLALPPYSKSVTKWQLVAELINNGANANIQDIYSEFPIDLAKRSQGKLEEGVMELLENMNNRPSFNQSDYSDEAFNRSGKLKNFLDEPQLLNWNSTKLARIFQIVHTQDLKTINGVLQHFGEVMNVSEIWDQELHSLLHIAIKYRDYSTVEYLLVYQGFSKKLNDTNFNADLVQLAMNNMERVLPSTFEHKSRILQLLLSIQPNLVESSVEIFTDLLFKDYVTPLLYSTAHVFSNGKQLELIKLLLEYNGNVSATTTFYNRTALHLAAERNYHAVTFMQIMRILIENQADTSAVDTIGNTFLHFIASKRAPAVFHEAVAYLDSINNTNSFTIKNNEGQTVLLNAVYNMEVFNETLEIFQRRELDFNEIDNHGISILFGAIYGGGRGAFLKNLIIFGTDWRLKDDTQNTPLHVAARCVNVAALKLFIRLGADINAQNRYGETPLHVVIKYEWTWAPIPKLYFVSELINNGANLSIRTNSGKLPGDMARESTSMSLIGVIQLLRRYQNFTQEVSSEWLD